MVEEARNLEQDAVKAVEEQIREHARAKEIFDALKSLPREPRTEYEVSVIGSVEPGHIMGRPDLEGQTFLVGSEGHILTTENPEPGSAAAKALRFAQAFGRHMDEKSGAIEKGLSGFAHIITADDAGELKPARGDILVEKKDGGFFGHPTKIRLIKPDMSEEQIREALDFIASRCVPTPGVE